MVVQRETTPNQPAHRWWVLGGVSLAIIMFALDMSIVNIALPTLSREFHTSFSTVQWVILSYLLVITSLEMGVARLGDLWGRKPLFLMGLMIFTLASALCGLSDSIFMLISFRALEGLGAVGIAALGIAIVADVFPPGERGKALGIVSGFLSAGVAAGPTVGGFLISWGSWRGIFWINVPLGMIAIAIISYYFRPQHQAKSQETFDFWGFLIFALSLSSFALGMTSGQSRGFGQWLPLSLLAIALVGFLGFLILQSRISSPMINLNLFRSWKLNRSLLASLLQYAVISGGLFALPFFLEIVKHYSAQQVGLLLAIAPIMNALVSPVAGYISDRVGARPVALSGLTILAIACYVLSGLSADTSTLHFATILVPYGLGLGLFQSPNINAIMQNIPKAYVSVGSGLVSLVSTLGQIIGIPIMGTLMIFLGGLPPGSSVLTANSDQLTQGFQGGYFVATLVIGTAIILLGSDLRIFSFLGKFHYRKFLGLKPRP